MNDKPEMTEKAAANPATLPLQLILKGITIPQISTLLISLVGLFLAGFGVGQWASAVSSERLVVVKEREVVELVRKLESLQNDRDRILGLVSNVKISEKRHASKSEFLNRYLLYILDGNKNGTMQKVFVDHVCALWKNAQRDIHSVEVDKITMQEISDGRPLSVGAYEALAQLGISREAVIEYQGLSSINSRIQPGATRGLAIRAPKDTKTLQDLEKKIHGAVRKGITTKSITFFDGSSYFVPQDIADAVHRRSDCAT